MAASDALIVGEDWISEHYFTTDAKSESFQAKVTERRKAWDEDARTVREDGDPESKADTVRSRFLAARGNLSADLASLLADPPDVADAKLPDLYARLRTVLGYHTGEYTLKQVGPIIRVTTPDLSEAAPLVIVEARAAATVEDLIAKDGSTLLTPYEPDEATTYTSVARLLSALFVADDGPEFALVLAGRWLLVAERARWAEGRYLAVDLQLVCDRNDAKSGGEIDRALACVCAESLAPDAEGGIWWHGVLEDSVKHTVGVSQDLREGMRLSIEIIANEVVSRRKAQGLDPLPQEQAQPLARQALRYLYRILFLLYAEASPELEVLPVGAEEYDQGYGLDRLRELTLVELTGPRAMNGTHLYDSLSRLFSLVDQGHEPPEAGEGEQEGLVFNSLRADLFLPKATALIDETGLGNAALQRVLRYLLLSKETRGKDRGFISYAELGINQLGAVYEGLMSYTGFFAEDDLYEVAKDGDASKGSWVVPVGRADGISQDDFVRVEDEVTGEKKAVVHRRGDVRLPAGRPGTTAVGVVLHARGADPVHRVPGARGTARPGRAHHNRRGDPRPDRLRAGPRVRCVRHRGRAAARRAVPAPPPGRTGQAHRPGQVPDRTAAGQGIDRAAPGVRRRPQRDRGGTGRDLALAGHDGVRAPGAVVRAATAPRQLADRRPSRRLHTRPGERQVVAEGDADRRADERHGRGDGERDDRQADGRPHPPLPAPRERLGIGGRGEGSCRPSHRTRQPS